MEAGRQPESEPEFESADEGLEEEFSNLRLSSQAVVPAEPVVDLTAFPAAAAHRGSRGPWQVELTGHQEITVRRVIGITPVICTEPIRFYVVWKIPGFQGNWDLTGLHTGRGTRAYEALLSLNGGFAQLRFLRVESIAEGRALFVAEADRQQVNRDRVNFRFNWE